MASHADAAGPRSRVASDSALVFARVLGQGFVNESPDLGAENLTAFFEQARQHA